MGHLWRISGDIYNCFDCVHNHGTWNSWGVTKIIDMRPNIRQFAGPDHWNDFDMMEVGNGMTEGEDRAHFTMWCMLASPLIAGNDVRNMTDKTRQLLTNKNVISINQDKLGIQAFLQHQKDSVDTWIKPLADGSWAYCFMNRSQKPKTISYDFVSQPVTDTVAKRSIDFSKQTLRMQDVFTGKDLGKTEKALQVTVQPHDVVLVKLMK
jgi:alpha-galactosidase